MYFVVMSLLLYGWVRRTYVRFATMADGECVILVVLSVGAFDAASLVWSGHEADGCNGHLQLRAASDCDGADWFVDASPLHWHFQHVIL